MSRLSFSTDALTLLMQLHILVLLLSIYVRSIRNSAPHDDTGQLRRIPRLCRIPHHAT